MNIFSRFSGLNYTRVKKAVLRRIPGVIKRGPRAICRKSSYRAGQVFKKVFTATPEARQSRVMELLARQIFEGRPWLCPILEAGEDYLLLPLFPQQQRLDLISRQMKEEERLHVAVQALDIALELLAAGYAHRDFHAKNLFWIKNQLVLVDFETMVAYPTGHRPKFYDSYDITGCGLPSPYRTENMSYIGNHCSAKSLQATLGVNLEQVRAPFEKYLRKCLRDSSRTFQKRGERHSCQAGRIYSSFSLPEFAIPASEAQRNSRKRIQEFQAANEGYLRGKTILDLGCHIGGMLFEVQNYRPGACLGLEYDADKVLISSKIAAYAGLNNVAFKCADVDELDPKKLGSFDIVFCLAIEAHVKKPDLLYRNLASLTKDTLYFEGNATTNSEEVRKKLKEAGFLIVEFLGCSTDDALPANNCRPLLRARRRV